MRLQQEPITALRNSSMWSSSAYIVTYDEHGGYFDHVVPPQLDAYGAGIRVPTWVISPYANKGHLEPTVYERARCRFGPAALPRDRLDTIGDLMECFSF